MRLLLTLILLLLFTLMLLVLLLLLLLLLFVSERGARLALGLESYAALARLFSRTLAAQLLRVTSIAGLSD